MIYNDTLSKLKLAGFPFQKISDNIYQFPQVVYKIPDLTELIANLPIFTKLEKVREGAKVKWIAYADDMIGVSDLADDAVGILYHKVKGIE